MNSDAGAEEFKWRELTDEEEEAAKQELREMNLRRMQEFKDKLIADYQKKRGRE
jgi:hypothetical protein